MINSILITGGAGFIGSRLAFAASTLAKKITVFDNLHPQVHGENATPPPLPSNCDFVLGDIVDRNSLEEVVKSCEPDLVFHLAAETGTGQSYDEPTRYSQVNIIGTTHLVEALRALPPSKTQRRIVLAGSRAVYGEGAYQNMQNTYLVGPSRVSENMARGIFAPFQSEVGDLRPCPTRETLPPAPTSIYASTKLMQEYVLQQASVEGDFTASILRFQNVYGPGQSLKNPYTGVLSIFSSQILSGAKLNIYEDGEIVRDFIFVDDVVDALVAAATAENTINEPINIGSGYPATILETAQILLDQLGAPTDNYEITGDFRPGDIRYAVADIERARTRLGWTPKISLHQGLSALAAWAKQEYGDRN